MIRLRNHFVQAIIAVAVQIGSLCLDSKSLSVAQLGQTQENVPLTLFQIIARAPLVVRARVVDSAGKMALLQIEDTIKGGYSDDHVRLDYRDLNLSLRGQEPVVFHTGEEDLFCLEPPPWRKPTKKNRDIRSLYHGRRGRLELPPEGAGVQIETVRTLAAIAAGAPQDQSARLCREIESANLVLREAALDELVRLRQPLVDDLPALTRLSRDPSPASRVRAMRLLALTFPTADSQAPSEEARIALEAVRIAVRSDEVEEVRVEAIRALGSWVRPDDLAAELKALSERDPSQMVRYEAQRVLFVWNRL